MTTILGLIPLASPRRGPEVQAPMARAVIGGLTVSTLVTLFLVPVIYTMAAEWQRRRREVRAEAGEEDAVGATAG